MATINFDDENFDAPSASGSLDVPPPPPKAEGFFSPEDISTLEEIMALKPTPHDIAAALFKKLTASNLPKVDDLASVPCDQIAGFFSVIFSGPPSSFVGTKFGNLTGLSSKLEYFSVASLQAALRVAKASGTQVLTDRTACELLARMSEATWLVKDGVQTLTVPGLTVEIESDGPKRGCISNGLEKVEEYFNSSTKTKTRVIRIDEVPVQIAFLMAVDKKIAKDQNVDKVSVMTLRDRKRNLHSAFKVPYVRTTSEEVHYTAITNWMNKLLCNPKHLPAEAVAFTKKHVVDYLELVAQSGWSAMNKENRQKLESSLKVVEAGAVNNLKKNMSEVGDFDKLKFINGTILISPSTMLNSSEACSKYVEVNSRQSIRGAVDLYRKSDGAGATLLSDGVGAVPNKFSEPISQLRALHGSKFEQVHAYGTGKHNLWKHIVEDNSIDVEYFDIDPNCKPPQPGYVSFSVSDITSIKPGSGKGCVLLDDTLNVFVEPGRLASTEIKETKTKLASVLRAGYLGGVMKLYSGHDGGGAIGVAPPPVKAYKNVYRHVCFYQGSTSHSQEYFMLFYGLLSAEVKKEGDPVDTGKILLCENPVSRPNLLTMVDNTDENILKWSRYADMFQLHKSRDMVTANFYLNWQVVTGIRDNCIRQPRMLLDVPDAKELRFAGMSNSTLSPASDIISSSAKKSMVGKDYFDE